MATYIIYQRPGARYQAVPVAITDQSLWLGLNTNHTHSHGRITNHAPANNGFRKTLAIALLALSAGGMIGPFFQNIRLEANYRVTRVREQAETAINPPVVLPPSAPIVFDPLVTPDGSAIEPVNTGFSLIIPKIGVNAPVTANVDPARADEYNEVLKTSVAHAATSFTPDQDGTVYLFSHSTNYDWFVRDLNAVFYLVKNLEKGDTIVLYYQNVRYTYTLTEKKVVHPNDTSYLVPVEGKKQLILQTCWPPGSTTQRLLIFADLVETKGEQI